MIFSRAKSQTDSGFTLVELMVVVGMVGTLAAIAIPNYHKFVNRTRQAEAKILLAGIYTAEVAFYAENNSYSSCLRQIGYEPIGLSSFNFFETPAYAGGPGMGTTGKGFYTHGIHYATATHFNCGPSANDFCSSIRWPADVTTTCDTWTDSFFLASNTASGTIPNYSTLEADTDIHQDSFVAAAVGYLRSTATTTPPLDWDKWTINQRKELLNVQSGI